MKDMTKDFPIRETRTDIKEQTDIPTQYNATPYKSSRKIIRDYSEKTFLEKRIEFVRWLLRNMEMFPSCAICGGRAEKGKLELRDVWVKRKNSHGKEFWCEMVQCSKCLGIDGRRLYDHEVKFYNLQPGYKKYPEAETFNGFHFDPRWNTRDIMLDEGVFEFEKGKDWDENIRAFWTGCEALMRFKIHFSVFFAEEMRTPHIHCYNLFPGVTDWAEKSMTYALFCQKVFPIEVRHLLDYSLGEKQTIALEFASHWKTGHMKKPMFESVPEVEEVVGQKKDSVKKETKHEKRKRKRLVCPECSNDDMSPVLFYKKKVTFKCLTCCYVKDFSYERANKYSDHIPSQKEKKCN